MDNYKTLAKDYEFLDPKKEIFKQESFFKKLIKKYSIKSCLDCACGTGWHLFMFKKLGLDCFGSDLSKVMLKQARKNLKGKRIPLKQEDFRKLSKSWKRKFDMIVFLTTSLPHMLTDKDTIVALKSTYGRLNDNGILVISNGISDSLLNNKPRFFPARILKNHAFYFLLEYPNPKRVIFNIIQVKKIKDSFKHSYDVIDYNAMRRSVLKRCFAKTKFRKMDYFGDYNFSKYSTKKSKRLIVIAQK